MGRKPLQPEERRVSVTIRLDQNTLDAIDDTISQMSDISEFVAGNRFVEESYNFPKNRTELISWILDQYLNTINGAFIHLNLTRVIGREAAALASPALQEIVESTSFNALSLAIDSKWSGEKLSIQREKGLKVARKYLEDQDTNK